MAPDINPSPLSSNPKVAGLAHAGASQVLEKPNKQTKIKKKKHVYTVKS